MRTAPRHTLARLAIGVTMIAAATAAHAQDANPAAASTPRSQWEFLMSSGTLVPTGAQRDVIARGGHSTAQLSYLVNATVAVTATLGWTRSRDIASATDAKLDVFMYDAGVELRAPRATTTRVTFTPFAGLGAGARTYDSHAAGQRGTHGAVGYASIGGDIGLPRVRVRLDIRDYLSGAAPFHAAGMRNDIVFAAGLRLVRQ